MKEKDLFNAINDIDLKYVKAAWKGSETAGEDEAVSPVAPIIVQSGRKSPMRIFGGAAACVGVLGAAAAVIMISGSGNINTSSPLSSGTESGVSQTEASSSDISVISTSDNAVIEENWKKLRAGNENYVADDPVEAVKKELAHFESNECYSLELYSLNYDLDRISHQIEFEEENHRLEETYGITDMEKMTVITAKINAELKDNSGNFKAENCRWYLLIQDEEGNWYIEAIAEESDSAFSEEQEPWVSLKEKQKDITDKDALTALQNYLNKLYGSDGTFTADLIRLQDDQSRAEIMISEAAAAKYGISPFGENHEFAHGFATAETIFHTKDEKGQNHYRYENYALICSLDGNWYIPEEFKSGAYTEEWTQEDMWEKMLENEKEHYGSCSDSDPLEVARKAANAFISQDGILSAHTEGCYYYDDEVEHYIHIPYAGSKEYYEAVAKYKYGIQDAGRVAIVVSQFEAELDPDKFYGNSHIDGALYILIQDDEGIWHIESQVDSLK